MRVGHHMLCLPIDVIELDTSTNRDFGSAMSGFVVDGSIIGI